MKLKELRKEINIIGYGEENEDKKEALQNKMGELIKEMADNGLKPKLFYGKGNIPAQRRRYKKRVMEEKRFQCKKCEHVFSDSSGLKYHTANKICHKEKKPDKTHCPTCNRDYVNINRHLNTKSHKKRAGL
jgi:rubredoxin